MKKRIISVILCICILVTGLGITPSRVSAYTKTTAATDDYTKWKQTSSTWGNEKPWPKAEKPKFGDAGCWITSVAMLLRHYGVVTESSVKKFNPIICNTQLMKYGVVNSAGDFEKLNKLKKAYPGFIYKGTVKYSFNKLKELYNAGYACIVHETKGHFVAVKKVNGNKVVVMDPGSKKTYLEKSDEIQYFKIDLSKVENSKDNDNVKEDAKKEENKTETSNDSEKTVIEETTAGVYKTYQFKALGNVKIYHEGNNAVVDYVIDVPYVDMKLRNGYFPLSKGETLEITIKEGEVKFEIDDSEKVIMTELTDKCVYEAVLKEGEGCTIVPKEGMLSLAEMVYVKMQHKNATVEKITVSSTGEYSDGKKENYTGESWTTVSKSKGVKFKVLSGELEVFVSREGYRKLEVNGTKFQ